VTKTERRIALGDGAQTTIETWGERGPLLLCVHGMTSSRRSWERLARALDGRFRVVAYDQRGHGDSADITAPMTLARGIRDVEDVAAALGEPIDVVVGHSWGGAVAIEAGLRLPVSGVAAIDPMIRQVEPLWYAEFLDELRELFTLQGEARDAKIRIDYRDWDPVDVEGKIHAVHSMTIVPIEGLMRENPPESWDLRDTIARYSKPLLLAMAAAGESINDDAVLAEIEAHHLPNVTIEFFPGAGHNIHRTAFDRFAHELDAWLLSNPVQPC
jgi:pimeloyl-ACP methyl ester carboxylesterase